MSSKWRRGLGCLALLSSMYGMGTAAEAATPPTAPADLRAFSFGLFSVALEWTDRREPGIVYWIERRPLNGELVNSGTGGNGAALIQFLDADTIYAFRIRAENPAGEVSYSNVAFVSTDMPPRPCQTTTQSMCLQNNRFELKSYWRIGQGPYVPGNAVALTSDTGYFWFFDPANVEMVVKVLRGCGLNRYYWVYAGGLTDVEVVWTVNDTALGQIKTYVNPAGTAFVPVQDTHAQGCP